MKKTYTQEELNAITPEEFKAKSKDEQDNIKAASMALQFKESQEAQKEE